MENAINNFNLKRYIGEGLSAKERKWHQVAALPAWFQAGLSRITAKYIDKGDYIEVRNSGIKKNGRRKTQIGKAITSDRKNVLLVKFYLLSPYAEYIVEFVDQKYKYAIVGSSGKKYLWILTRDLEIMKDRRDELIAIAKRKGYDVSRLELSTLGEKGYFKKG